MPAHGLSTTAPAAGHGGELILGIRAGAAPTVRSRRLTRSALPDHGEHEAGFVQGLDHVWQPGVESEQSARGELVHLAVGRDA